MELNHFLRDRGSTIAGGAFFDRWGTAVTIVHVLANMFID